jgi:hypothetical protein
VNGLDWQTWTHRFSAGLNTGADPRTLDAPELAKAFDCQYDETGGIQTRYPFEAAKGDILGGGTISDARRLVANGAELLLFTVDTLYSWNAQQSKWVSKGTHLAVKVDEESRFVTSGDQIDCDRAELDDTIVYAWTDGTSVYVAAVDKTTGGVLVAPTAIASSSRPRLVALSTKILLFTVLDPGPSLVVRAIDPADVATGIASAATEILATTVINDYYDAARVTGADQAVVVARRAPSTDYEIATVTAGLVLAQTTKARACDGPIAVACTAAGTQVEVVRASGFNIVGDLITVSSLADVSTAHAIGTFNGTCEQIAAAFRTVADGGEYRCYAFWSDTESDAPDGNSGAKYNWVDTAAAVGTQAFFVMALGVASRAFDHDGSVYVNLAFAGASSVGGGGVTAYGQRAQLQNSYFLYRDDGFLVAKQAFQRGGGFAESSGHLPGVALTSGATAYSWCGAERRIIPLGGDASGYADRGPRDVTITFDSNEARRCARLGQTMYIACGEGVLQYDGTLLAELGFHYFPYFFEANTGSTGDIADGFYSYKFTYRSYNARGEMDRSTTAIVGSIEMTTGPARIVPNFMSPLNVTHRTGIAVEAWRTLVNPLDDSPFYLVTSKDPADLAGTNFYIENSTTLGVLGSFPDILADDDVRSLETNPENGAILENLAPPPASVIAASDTRLFLAGIAGDPDRVMYSKQRQDGEVPSFHDALTVAIPTEGGSITGMVIASDGTPVIFRETATYVLLNDGYDNAGGGQNYVARCASPDSGAVSHESIAVTDGGVIVFKSSRGWCRMNRAFAVEYIGEPVSDYDDEDALAITVVEAQHQIRILTASRMLMLDTKSGKWAEWTIDDGVHACMWQGAHHYLTDTGSRRQLTTYTDLDYGMDIETAWIKLADLQGMKRIRWFKVLGEYRSSHALRVRVARDYWKDGVDTYFQDKTWEPSPTVVGGPEVVKHSPSIQQMSAIKIRLTATALTQDLGEQASITLESGGVFLVITAVVPGTGGNDITLTNDGGVGAMLLAADVGTSVYVTSGETESFDDLAAAINSGSDLVTATVVGDGTTQFVIPALFQGQLSGGTDLADAPTGEALKLTGISLELGMKRGLNRHLPSAQKQ